MTELVPWMVLTTALGLAAALRWRGDYAVQHDLRGWRWSLAAGGALLALSVLINARGATARATRAWNEIPVPVDKNSARVWDWHYPQILAGLVPLPLPHDFPLIANRQRLFFGHEQARAYQYEGWLNSDAEYSWTAANVTKLIFATDHPESLHWLWMEFGAFVHPPEVTRQRVSVYLNEQFVGEFVGKTLQARHFVLPLPAGLLRRDHNVLTFDLLDSVVPADLGIPNDTRRLGISVHWLEFTDNEPMPEPTPES